MVRFIFCLISTALFHLAIYIFSTTGAQTLLTSLALSAAMPALNAVVTYGVLGRKPRSMTIFVLLILSSISFVLGALMSSHQGGTMLLIVGFVLGICWAIVETPRDPAANNALK